MALQVVIVVQNQESRLLIIFRLFLKSITVVFTLKTIQKGKLSQYRDGLNGKLSGQLLSAVRYL